MINENNALIHEVLAADELIRQKRVDADNAALRERQTARMEAQRQQQDAANQEFAGALAEVRERNAASEAERQKVLKKAEKAGKNGSRNWGALSSAELRKALGNDFGVWL
jgi:flagellar motility protein MotE (MotC chaperone)